MKASKDNQWVTDKNKDVKLSVTTALGDREDQQDCFGYEINETEAFVVLCDGMGGHSGGKIASNSAVDFYLKAFEDKGDQMTPIDFLYSTTEKANTKILELKNEVGEKLNGGTTVVAIIVAKNKLYWASSGDSRVYLFRKGEFVQLTIDHNYRTVLDEQLEAGQISRETYDREIDKGEALVSFLGIGDECLVNYNSEGFELLPDDRILMMSDGLYKLVSDKEILNILVNFSGNDDALNALEIKAKKNSENSNTERDNMTVAMIKAM